MTGPMNAPTTTPTTTPYRSTVRAAGDGFGRLLLAEWTKFRSVRGWVIGVGVAMFLTVIVGLLPESSCSNNNGPCPPPPVGPGGEAVVDHFYFVHQPLFGDGSMTVKVTSLTGRYSTHGVAAVGQGGPQNMTPGLEPWSKAGIIIGNNTHPGAPYAAMMVTGSNGVRMQYNYTQDIAGLPGAVSPASPRWLRLTRSGDTITGYDSTDGTHWTTVGTAHLTGLPANLQGGMFAASPGHTVLSQSLGSATARGGPSLATAVLDNVDLRGRWAGNIWPGNLWQGDNITDGSGGPDGTYGSYQQAGGTFTVSGSGDIAPDVGGGGITLPLAGTFFGLIALIVVAAMFVTAEYRRGLIRTTLVASPRRGRVLAAKAIVVGAVTGVAGLVAVTVAWVVGLRKLRASVPVDPVSTGTEVRMVLGTAALLAVSAVLAMAIGALLRRGAAAVTTVIAVIVLPYLLAVVPTVLPPAAEDWLLRLTPAAAFAIQQAYPAYPQVDHLYSATEGYFPLPPWAGFAVLCGYAVVALGLAVFLVRRRDA